MTDSSQITKLGQYGTLGMGVFLLYLSVWPAFNYFNSGVLKITLRSGTYEGPLAATAVIGFFAVGAVLVFTAIRNIRRLP